MNSFLESFELSGQDIIARAVRILIILIALVIALRVAKSFFKNTGRRLEAMGRDGGHLRYIRYVVTAIIYFLCLTGVIREIPGLDNIVTSLLAGSGILAMIVGIASQQAVGNVVSGAMIVLFKPFKLGDTVRYLSGDVIGAVEEITLRHTVIRTAEHKRVIIPNGLMNSNVIENSSFGDPWIFVRLDITVAHSSDTKLAMKIISEEILAHPRFLDTRGEEKKTAGIPAVSVRVQGLNQSGALLRAWVAAENDEAGVQVKSDLLLAIQARFQESGIAFA